MKKMVVVSRLDSDQAVIFASQDGKGVNILDAGTAKKPLRKHKRLNYKGIRPGRNQKERKSRDSNYARVAVRERHRNCQKEPKSSVKRN